MLTVMYASIGEILPGLSMTLVLKINGVNFNPQLEGFYDRYRFASVEMYFRNGIPKNMPQNHKATRIKNQRRKFQSQLEDFNDRYRFASVEMYFRNGIPKNMTAVKTA
jgi:hypothetical protein